MNRLSGKRWNHLEDNLVQWWKDGAVSLHDALEADGYAPFTEPVPPRRQLEILTAMAAQDPPDPAYDLKAQAAKASLEKRYGPVAAAAPPLGSVNSPPPSFMGAGIQPAPGPQIPMGVGP